MNIPTIPTKSLFVRNWKLRAPPPIEWLRDKKRYVYRQLKKEVEMNYSNMKKNHLKIICKERKIKGINRKTKDELVAMIVRSKEMMVFESNYTSKTIVSTQSQSFISTPITYISILKEALDAPSCNSDCLRRINGIVCIEDEIHTILSLSNKSWAPLKATIVSIVANWFIRLGTIVNIKFK